MRAKTANLLPTIGVIDMKIRIEKSKFSNAKIFLSTNHVPFSVKFLEDAVEVDCSNKYKNTLDKLKNM